MAIKATKRMRQARPATPAPVASTRESVSEEEAVLSQNEVEPVVESEEPLPHKPTSNATLSLPSHVLFMPAPPTSSHEKSPPITVVLDAATLETVRVGRRERDAQYQLLNCDDHQGMLKRANREVATHRPDITHQCLLTLMDSPLNKAGKLRVLIRTQQRVLIEVHPQTRIPRTFKRFCGLMVQLLHKLRIRSTDGQERLLSVIKQPLEDHLPVNARKIALSAQGPCVKMDAFARYLMDPKSVENERQLRPVVFYVGAMAHGEDAFEGAEERISVSHYNLSASVACSKICQAFESVWHIC